MSFRINSLKDKLRKVYITKCELDRMLQFEVSDVSALEGKLKELNSMKLEANLLLSEVAPDTKKKLVKEYKLNFDVLSYYKQINKINYKK